MKTIVSSHILDSVSGSSAVGIRVALFRIAGDSKKQKLFEVLADRQGRIFESVDTKNSDADTEYELVFYAAEYFSGQSLPAGTDSIVKTVVIRFLISAPQPRYHIPLMLSPYSYSVWWAK
jgi:5-hydroxyisourate hydrolase